MPHAYPVGAGWIEVIAGCMFSGKTEELIRRLHRARIARQRLVVIKPATDTRYAAEEVVSHADGRLPCTPVAHAADILAAIPDDVAVVGIDEAQFFGPELTEVCEVLASRGVRVIVAGLDLDFQGRPFDPMPALMAVAEHVTKTLAVCVVCGAPAGRSQRLVPQGERVLLGADAVYEARCRRHWNPGAFDARQEQLPLDLGR